MKRFRILIIHVIVANQSLKRAVTDYAHGYSRPGSSGVSLVPRLSVKREMWGRKGEPGFYCRPDPSHSGGFGFPPYFPVFDFIIIIIILSNQRFFVQDGEFVSESVSSSVSSSDSSSHYPQALSHALSMLGLPNCC